jgi:mono/diheme cytochrome c family protein
MTILISGRTGRGPRKRLLSVIAAAGAAMLAMGTAQAREPFAADAFSNYQGNVENGKYMFNASGCGACHGSGENLELLSGGLEMETAIGKFFAPNISNHPNGVSGWSNADYLNAVVVGLDREGNHLYPVMPYVSYGGMKPEDVLDIKAYIETLPGSDAISKDHEISFPFNRQTTLSLWKRRNYNTAAYAPDDGSQKARGRYLVENVGQCNECHTPRTLTYGLDGENRLKGEKGLTGAFAPDITQAKLAGLPSADVFTEAFLEEGKKLSGSPVAVPVKRAYLKGLKELTEEDRVAMYAYLSDTTIKQKVVTSAPVTADAACKDEGATAMATGAGVQFVSEADAFVGRYCRNCHGPGESAQGSFPAGDLSSIAANASFVTPGDKSKSLLYTSVTSGRMPLGSKPSADEVAQLGGWIDSLTAQSPEVIAAKSEPERQRGVIKRDQEIQATLIDIGKVNELDRQYMRYFSFRPQHNGHLPCEDEEAFKKRLDVYSGAFRKLINSLSYGSRLVIPEEVQSTNGLVVRVDLRDLEWDVTDYEYLIPFYFYGIDPYSDPTLAALVKETGTQLPIMRADWFASNALKPEHYNFLLKLPEHIRILEDRMKVDVDRNIRERKVVRAGFIDGSSGVSDHNRMLERHDLPFGGYYWKSYDFAESIRKQDLRRFPHGPTDIEPLDAYLESFEHDGGEMIFSLPNGMQGYYLSTADGKQINVGPTEIVSFRKRPIGKGIEIINGRSCVDCHANGIISKLDQLREHIKTSTLFSLDQQDVLLDMYVEQEQLNEWYLKDRTVFVNALDRLGIAEKAPDGSLNSKRAAGDAELMTAYADLYEDELNFESLASEFDMTPDEFRAVSRRIDDPLVLRIVLDWVTQLEAGATIPRFEVEEQFAYLVDPILQLRPLAGADGYNADPYKDVAKVEHKAKDAYDGEKLGYQEPKKEVYDQQKEVYVEAKQPVYEEPKQVYKPPVIEEPYSAPVKYEPEKKVAAVPAYKQEEKVYKQPDADYEAKVKVKLAINVPTTTVYVGDKLAFDLSTNKACTPQVFYIESDGNVEVIPDVMLGNGPLQPGESRVIPSPGSGELVFDTSAPAETMLVYCREADYAGAPFTVEEARALVAESAQPATRGLAIKLAQKAKEYSGDAGVHMVTFKVQDY